MTQAKSGAWLAILGVASLLLTLGIMIITSSTSTASSLSDHGARLKTVEGQVTAIQAEVNADRQAFTEKLEEISRKQDQEIGEQRVLHGLRANQAPPPSFR